MQAFILAGGKGTRLRPLTVYTPKPIVPLVNRPFMLYQIDALKRASVKEITLSLSYQPDKIAEVLGTGSEFGAALTFITEPSPLGTAGAYRFATAGNRETAVVLNGDVLTNVDLAKVIEFHRTTGSEATIVLAPVEDPTAYGLVESDADGSVLAFREKPTADEAALLETKNINAGIYILEPSVLDLIPENEIRSFEYDVFPELLRQGRAFNAFVMKDEYWRDIGNPQSYLAAHHDFLAGKVPGFEIVRGSDHEQATTAFVDKASVIGEGCHIKPNCRIINSVLGPGVHVEEKAVVENSVIWSNSRVSAFSTVEGSIVGRSCYIGKNAVVTSGSVLGDKTSLTDYTRV
jgi:NDP-sugar pyrophosphorylase family protein